MKKWTIPSLLFFLMAGCGLMTLHPIFTPEELVVHPALAGTWKAHDGFVRFAPATECDVNEIPEPLRSHRNNFYLCTRMNDQGKTTSRSLAFLVRLGNMYFLDQYPLLTDDERLIDGFFLSHSLVRHEISRIDFSKNGRVLIWRGFRDKYVEDLISAKQVRISHTYFHESDEALITAPTKELQAFLVKYGSRKEAYNDDEKIIYTRNK